jgi:hypothetical protein
MTRIEAGRTYASDADGSLLRLVSEGRSTSHLDIYFSSYLQVAGL